MSADLTALTAADAATAIAKGDITSEALVKACLDRVEARDGEVQAWAWLDPARALEQARAADETRREGKGVGPLHGVPVGIKDIIDTADMPTQCGSPLFKDRQPDKDAMCVAGLRSAGAIIMGKTVTTELASLTPPKTRNPVDPAYTPGGSSSGSAAGVASGMIPAALATQTGGSVIRPASYCGIYALKPTLGLISRTGVLLQSHTLDTVGVYGRSIDDLGLLTDAMSTQDPGDPASYRRSQPSLLAMSREAPPIPPIFCYLRAPVLDDAEAITREAFGEVVEALGDRCEAMDLNMHPDIVAAWRTVQSAENARYYGEFLKRSGEMLTEGMRERLETGAKIPPEQYQKALSIREPAYAVIEDMLTSYNAILTPAATGPAPKGHGSTGDPVFNGPWTFLGCPAVTVPLLDIDGMPLGVQLVGLRRDDGRLLRTARWLVEHMVGLG